MLTFPSTEPFLKKRRQLRNASSTESSMISRPASHLVRQCFRVTLDFDQFWAIVFAWLSLSLMNLNVLLQWRGFVMPAGSNYFLSSSSSSECWSWRHLYAVLGRGLDRYEHSTQVSCTYRRRKHQPRWILNRSMENLQLNRSLENLQPNRSLENLKPQNPNSIMEVSVDPCWTRHGFLSGSPAFT